MNIKSYEFSSRGKEILSKNKKAEDWPVVYLINNDKKMYIGETQNALIRFEQHLKNPEKKGLTDINVIYDDEFNKSAILDIEQSLIQLCGADGKYELLNCNGGQSSKHNYYQRKKYLDKIDDIWRQLKKKKIVLNDLEDIRNSDLFKYSPYNTLTAEQSMASNAIIEDIIKKLSEDRDGTAIINGGAGTGKTIVLINLMYKLVGATKFDVDDSSDDPDRSEYLRLMMLIRNYLKGHDGGLKKLKIGYICPMTSLRKTMKKVFRLTGNGLKSKMVIGPFDILKSEDKFDVLLVDEAHRLARRKNISFMGTFDRNARSIGLNPMTATELDMIVAKSRYRVLVYDKNQSIKESDLTEKQFFDGISKSSVLEKKLSTQMRCLGGEEYTDYLDRIFEVTQKEKEEIENYDFRIFDDAAKMIDIIRGLDKKYGLCRNAAGYSWEWKSKPYIKNGYDYIMKNGLADIDMDGHAYVWNMTNKEFILSENAVNEIGCIHTLQGYDLNYVGVIFGREIDYDPIKRKIVIDRKKFFDKNVKNGADDETLKRYIINSYKVMMTRGIKGCYVYAYNQNLREYLGRYIEKWKD